MPLPRGTWKINLNGQEGDLVIPATDDNAGNIQGITTTVFGAAIVNLAGFWDEVSGSLTLTALNINVNATTPLIVLKGCLITTPFTPQPGQDVIATLSGYAQVATVRTDVNSNFVSFTFLPSTTRRNIFGWVATMTVVN